jgi:hypothetical protein
LCKIKFIRKPGRSTILSFYNAKCDFHSIKRHTAYNLKLQNIATLLEPTVYAVAYSKGLVPEMANVACHTLGHPLTFESLDDALWLFKGEALHDLIDFCLCSIDNYSSNLQSFSSYHKGPSTIWVGCPMAHWQNGKNTHCLPTWLESLHTGPMLGHRFTKSIPISAQLCDRYMKALQNHVREQDCDFCMKVHILEGEKYCEKLRDISMQAWNIPAPTLGETWDSNKL